MQRTRSYRRTYSHRSSTELADMEDTNLLSPRRTLSKTAREMEKGQTSKRSSHKKLWIGLAVASIIVIAIILGKSALVSNVSY